MSEMILHFLDARSSLATHQAWLADKLSDTHEQVKRLLDLRPIDVVVRAGKHVIPEKGHLGYAPGPGVVFVTVDPDSETFRENANASLERMFAHELHHSARWDGPGYGRTLGEALVSEGLAGNFVLETFGGDPEPWECVERQVIREHLGQATQDWERSNYNHPAWFFGASKTPRWLGYSLGFALVEAFLAKNDGERPSTLAHADAQLFRRWLDSI